MVTREGEVIACHGRHLLVEISPGSILSCVTRSRRGGIACGDRVMVAATGVDKGVIETTEPRTSVFYRRDGERTKILAANVSLVVIVFAVAPAPHEDLLDRCLAAAEQAGTEVLLVFNKTDLGDPGMRAAETAARYLRLGYSILELSANRNIDTFRSALQDRLSVLVGQSGVGKSTLINRLIANAGARAAATSAGNDKGKHTTTHTQLYRLDARSAIIDSPGLQLFGLSHLVPADLACGFVEFRALLGQCRFSNCAHRGEPGCALEHAAKTGAIERRRLESYRRILATITGNGLHGRFSPASSPP